MNFYKNCTKGDKMGVCSACIDDFKLNPEFECVSEEKENCVSIFENECIQCSKGHELSETD